MDVLEIECPNDKCNCDCTIGQTQHQNMIFITDFSLNETFTCDDCNAVILVCDEKLMKVYK